MSAQEMPSDKLAVFFVASALSLAITLYFNVMMMIPGNPYFQNSLQYLSEKYITDITPASFTFAGIWSLIYFFQIAWVVYSLTTLFRTNSQGVIYRNPVVMPKSFHVNYIMSCGANIGFLFAFDQENIEMAMAFCFVTTITGFMALYTNCQLTLQNQAEMKAIEPKDLTTVYVLVQNGLDLYFSWTLVAAGISTAIVLQYSYECAFFLNPAAAATLVLASLFCVWVLVYTIDITLLFKPYEYVYGRYLVGLWALIGIIVKNYDITNPNTMVEIVGLGIILLFLAAKIVVEFKVPHTMKYSKMINEKA